MEVSLNFGDFPLVRGLEAENSACSSEQHGEQHCTDQQHLNKGSCKVHISILSSKKKKRKKKGGHEKVNTREVVDFVVVVGGAVGGGSIGGVASVGGVVTIQQHKLDVLLELTGSELREGL